MKYSGALASCLAVVSLMVAPSPCDALRIVMYLDEWHASFLTNNRPEEGVFKGITHVIMAFADPQSFTTGQPDPYIPFTTLKELRDLFDPDTQIGIALGGWAGSASFSTISSTAENREAFAGHLAEWMEDTGFDFVDIDWEYPGGNGANYKEIQNSEQRRGAEITNFPLLLEAMKAQSLSISIAVAGVADGMLAFQPNGSAQKISGQVDFINLMSYDYVNRRSTLSRHHTGFDGTKDAVKRYLGYGLAPDKINLGFAFYAKWFQTDAPCEGPIGCSIIVGEDGNGADDNETGVLTFEKVNMAPPDPTTLANLPGGPDGMCGVHPGEGTFQCREPGYCCSQDGFCGKAPDFCRLNCQRGYGSYCEGPDTRESFKKARASPKTDGDGVWYWDSEGEHPLFWTWEAPGMMQRKFDEIVKDSDNPLGGIMGWSLGEDSYDWALVKKMRDMVSETST